MEWADIKRIEIIARNGFNPNTGAIGIDTLRFMTGLLIGDVNRDGNVDLLDVAPFVELLTNGDFQAEADINQDGVIDLLDVAPFVNLLTGS